MDSLTVLKRPLKTNTRKIEESDKIYKQLSTRRNTKPEEPDVPCDDSSKTRLGAEDPATKHISFVKLFNEMCMNKLLIDTDYTMPGAPSPGNSPADTQPSAESIVTMYNGYSSGDMATNYYHMYADYPREHSAKVRAQLMLEIDYENQTN